MNNDEQTILSAVAQGQINDIINSGVFRWNLDQSYAKILKACQIIHLRGQAVTLLNIHSECGLAGEEWLRVRELWQEAKSSAPVDWRPAALRIINRSMKESGLSTIEELERTLQSAPDPRQALVTGITRLSALVDNGTLYNPTPSHHYKQGIMGDVIGSTGVRAIDRLLGGGIWSQALVGVAFPSSHGKSTLGYTTLASAVGVGRRGILFTFETQTSTAVARVLASLTGLPVSETIKRKASSPEKQVLMDQGLERIDKYLRVYDLTFNNPSKMEQVIRLENPELCVIDHIDMVDPNSAARNASRNDHIGDVADASLQWTIKYGLTIFLNSQLSNAKQAELKRNHDLTQVDFFGSSRVYNALDFALIGLRHWYKPNTHYVRLKKNRKLGIVDIDVEFYHNPLTQTFEDIP